MEEYEDAARKIEQGLRHLRDLIEAERGRLDGGYDESQANDNSYEDPGRDYR